MSSLLDLPLELLILILERVGGRELRRGKGVARLTVCRIWYAAALPIYLSGFGISNVQLYGHDIQNTRGRFGYTNLRPLMHKNTRNLRIHLRGHPWDEATARADEDGEYTTWNEPPEHMEDDHRLILEAIQQWREMELEPCLDELFSDMRNFEALEHLVVEARSEPLPDLNLIPHRHYMRSATISILALNLPFTHCLVSFTLDTYGTNMRTNGHVCNTLANVLPRIENVRLRMARICPDMLNFKPPAIADVKLKHLTIKTYSPETTFGDPQRSISCTDWFGVASDQLAHAMVRASRMFLAKLDVLSLSKLCFRISHLPVTFPRIHVADCRSMRQYRLQDERHAHESDGRPCWFEMDGNLLVDGGRYIYYR